jgi:hypothetical protein
MKNWKNKILLILFLCLLILTIAATYYKYFVAFDITTLYDDYGEVELESESTE